MVSVSVMLLPPGVMISSPRSMSTQRMSPPVVCQDHFSEVSGGVCSP